MPRSRSSRRDVSMYSLVAEGLLAVLFVFAPLALGSAAPWAFWPMVGLGLTAFCVAFAGAIRQKQRIALPPFAAVLALCVVLCALQLLPLPGALLSLLSPSMAELREFALVPLGLTGPRPVSMDPPATWRALALHGSYLAVALTVVQLARSRRAKRRMLAVTAFAALAVTVIGLGHMLVRAEALFGFYRFEGGSPLLTTFGNPNHLAAYLTLGAGASLSLALSAEDRQRTALWIGAFVLCGVGVLLTLSRGGIVFFFALPAIFIALLMRRRWSEAVRGAEDRSRNMGVAAERRTAAAKRKRSLAAVGGAALVATVAIGALGAYLAWEQLEEQWLTADSVDKLKRSKVEVFPSVWTAAKAFPVLGMGRGAFEAAYTRFQELHETVTFTHPENLVLQVLSEFGLVGGALVLLLGAWALVRLFWRSSAPLADLALVAGVLALVVHDQLDFALEFPATAFGAILLLGVASRGVEENGWSVPRVGVFAGASVVMVAVLGAVLLGRSTLRSSEEALQQRAAELSPDALRTEALAAIDRHPAHYALYATVGRAYSTPKVGSPREALAFANRALYLRPSDVEGHWIAARALLQLGKRSQAFLEYRLAYQNGIGAGAVLDDAIRFARTPEELRRAVPDEPPHIVNLIHRLRALRRTTHVHPVLESALADLAEHPSVGELWSLYASLKLEAKDPAAALAAIEEAERRSPSDRRIAIARAHILAALGRRTDAVALLEALSFKHPDDTSLSFSLAEHLMGASRHREAREALDRASPFVGASHQRVRLLSLQARSFEAEGRHSRALQAWQSAAHLSPREPGLFMNQARIEESIGRYEDASRSLRAAVTAGADSANLKDWLARLDQKLHARKVERERRLLEGTSSTGGME